MYTIERHNMMLFDLTFDNNRRFWRRSEAPERIRTMSYELPTTTRGSVVKAVRKHYLGIKTYGLAVDALLKAGYTAMFCTAPKKGEQTSAEHKQRYAALKLAVVAGFTASQQKLLEKNTKELDDTKKIEKRGIQQAIGARVSDFKKQLQRREDIKNGVKKKPRVPISVEERTETTLVELIEYLKAAENTLFDCEETINLLKKAKDEVSKR